MTDVEMAIEWVKDNADSCRSKNMNGYDFAVQAFLAALKAGSQLDKVWYEDFHEGKWIRREANGAKWHKVDKEDLPDDCRYVWTNVGAGYHDDDGWWDDFGRLQGVVAWCEPKFEEE